MTLEMNLQTRQPLGELSLRRRSSSNGSSSSLSSSSSATEEIEVNDRVTIEELIWSDGTPQMNSVLEETQRRALQERRRRREQRGLCPLEEHTSLRPEHLHISRPARRPVRRNVPPLQRSESIRPRHMRALIKSHMTKEERDVFERNQDEARKSSRRLLLARTSTSSSGSGSGSSNSLSDSDNEYDDDDSESSGFSSPRDIELLDLQTPVPREDAAVITAKYPRVLKSRIQPDETASRRGLHCSHHTETNNREAEFSQSQTTVLKEEEEEQKDSDESDSITDDDSEECSTKKKLHRRSRVRPGPRRNGSGLAFVIRQFILPNPDRTRTGGLSSSASSLSTQSSSRHQSRPRSDSSIEDML